MPQEELLRGERVFVLRHERVHHRARFGARHVPRAHRAAAAAAAATAVVAAAAAMAAVVFAEGCAVGLLLLLLPAVVRLQDDGERCDQRR